MPSKSKSQQRFFGLVDAYKKGDVKGSEVSKEVKDAADSMTKKEIKKFASTKQKGLPERVKKDKKETNECSKKRRVMISEEQYNEIMRMLESDDTDVVVSLEDQNTTNNLQANLAATKKAAVENGINVNDPDVKLGTSANVNGTQGTIVFNQKAQTGTNNTGIYESKIIKVRDFIN